MKIARHEVKKKPFVISYLRALMKLRINATIDKTEVTIIANTRNNPSPPASRLFGNLIPTNAKSITNVKRTAI
jgi:hypothetical protein